MSIWGGAPNANDDTYAFENTAIDANMKVMDIQRVSANCRCKKCQQDQKVDIVGKDQIGEAKSRSFKQVGKKGAQARRLRDIQQKKFSAAKNLTAGEARRPPGRCERLRWQIPAAGI